MDASGFLWCCLACLQNPICSSLLSMNMLTLVNFFLRQFLLDTHLKGVFTFPGLFVTSPLYLFIYSVFWWNQLAAPVLGDSWAWLILACSRLWVVSPGFSYCEAKFFLEVPTVLYSLPRKYTCFTAL